MRKILVLASFLLFSSGTFCQSELMNPTSDDERTFVKVEEEATFPGGIDEWRKFLQKNLKPSVPVKRGAPAGKYTVIVRFIVNTDGSLDAMVAETRHGYGMEEEVLRTLSKAKKWIPAKQQGKEVRAYRRQPITFIVSEDEGRGRKKS